MMGWGLEHRETEILSVELSETAYFLKHTCILDQEDTPSKKEREETDNFGLFAFFMSSKNIPKF